jgi:hypothetical protein
MDLMLVLKGKKKGEGRTARARKGGAYLKENTTHKYDRQIGERFNLFNADRGCGQPRWAFRVHNKCN